MAYHPDSLEPTSPPGMYSTYHPSTIFSAAEQEAVRSAFGFTPYHLQSAGPRFKTISSPSSVSGYTRSSSVTYRSDDSGYGTQSPDYNYIKAPLPCRYSCVLSNCGFSTYSYQEFELHHLHVHARGVPHRAANRPLWDPRFENRSSQYEPFSEQSSEVGDFDRRPYTTSEPKRRRLRLSVRKITGILRQISTKSSPASIQTHEHEAPPPVYQRDSMSVTHDEKTSLDYSHYAPSAQQQQHQEIIQELPSSPVCYELAANTQNTNSREDLTQISRDPTLQEHSAPDYQHNAQYTIHNAETARTPISLSDGPTRYEAAHRPSHHSDGTSQAAADVAHTSEPDACETDRRDANDNDTTSQSLSRASSCKEHADLRVAIEDLSEKVNLLLQQTQPSRTPSFRSEQLRASVMQQVKPCSNQSEEPSSPTLIWPSEPLSISRATSNATVCSRRSGNCSRSQSEPPLERLPLSEWQAVTRQRGNESSSGSNYSYTAAGASNNKAPSQSYVPASSPAGISGGNGSNGEGSGGQRSRKRPRLEVPDISKERFPCIFAVAEPHLNEKSQHRKKHEHVSQLLRHLRSHDFYACQHCFTKFPDKGSQDAHGENSCVKICTKRTCRRRYLAGTVLPQSCQCITTPEEQWCELFRLQYPGKEVPDIFSDGDAVSSTRSMADDSAFFDFERYAAAQSPPVWSQPAPQAHHGHKRAHSTRAPSHHARDHARPAGMMPDDAGAAYPSPVSAREKHQQDELQALRQKVSVIEQRLSRPQRREQELEMVLKNVWQALVRSGSADAQPESATWDLVKLLTPNILSTTATHGLEEDARAGHAAMDKLDDGLHVGDGTFGGGGLFDAPFLFNAGDVHGLESGYGSLGG